MVENKKILEFLKEISFPRSTGTEGDKRVQNIIRERFSELSNGKIGEQEFFFSQIFMNGVLNLFHPLIGLLIITNIILILYNMYLLALFFSSSLFFISLFSRQIISFLQFRVHEVGHQHSARNIWIDFDPTSETKQNIVFLAHYDSISHALSPLIEGAGYFLGFIGGVIFSVHCIFYLFPIIFFKQPAPPTIQLFWGFIIAILTLIELFNKKGNNSDGALDNASAVAQCYHLAHEISKNPLKNTRIILVATGAEEWGDYGAYYFVKENPFDLSPKNSRFVIVDSIGIPEKSSIIHGIGLPMRHWSIKLENIAKKMIKEFKPPLKMRSLPPLLQIASDHIPVDKAGYEFIWFASDSFVIHSLKDNIKVLDEVNFIQICEFIEKYVRELDYDVN